VSLPVDLAALRRRYKPERLIAQFVQRKDSDLFSAAKAGIPVLTANRGDFDLIQQAAGHGEFIHYIAT